MPPKKKTEEVISESVESHIEPKAIEVIAAPRPAKAKAAAKKELSVSQTRSMTWSQIKQYLKSFL